MPIMQIRHILIKDYIKSFPLKTAEPNHILSLRNFVGEGIIKQQWTIEEMPIFSKSSHLEWRVGCRTQF
jgi:hypothetical protein